MNLIIRPRETGKARQLLEAAAQTDAIVAAENPGALQTKAKAYKIYGLEIISYDDLIEGNYHTHQRAYIHNGDKFMKYLMAKKYGLELCGFSATVED